MRSKVKLSSNYRKINAYRNSNDGLALGQDWSTYIPQNVMRYLSMEESIENTEEMDGELSQEGRKEDRR
jgi:hypothetical protein